MKRILHFLVAYALPGAYHFGCGKYLRGISISLSFFVFEGIALPSFFVQSFAGLVFTFVALFSFAFFVSKDSMRIAAARALRKPLFLMYSLVLVLGGQALLSKVILSQLQAGKAVTDSMSPSIMRGDHFLVDKRKRVTKHLGRGDLIMLQSPSEPRKNYVKRVLGVEGDTIVCGSTGLTVSGRFFAGVFWSKSPSAFRIPKKAFFVISDSLLNSMDSRHFGIVDSVRVIGKPAYIYYSTHFGRIGKKL